MPQINAGALLTDDRPQRLDACSREIGEGHTEDFAVGAGETEGRGKAVDLAREYTNSDGTPDNPSFKVGDS